MGQVSSLQHIACGLKPSEEGPHAFTADNERKHDYESSLAKQEQMLGQVVPAVLQTSTADLAANGHKNALRRFKQALNMVNSSHLPSHHPVNDRMEIPVLASSCARIRIHQRHDRARDLLHTMCRDVGWHCAVEQHVRVSPVDGAPSQARTDLLITLATGQRLTVDVRLVDSPIISLAPLAGC